LNSILFNLLLEENIITIIEFKVIFTSFFFGMWARQYRQALLCHKIYYIQIMKFKEQKKSLRETIWALK
jgi:hypothetical protein